MYSCKVGSCFKKNVANSQGVSYCQGHSLPLGNLRKLPGGQALPMQAAAGAATYRAGGKSALLRRDHHSALDHGVEGSDRAFRCYGWNSSCLGLAL